MKDFDSIEEILDFAIEEERGAARLYERIAALMEAEAMRRVFLEFAEEERRHEAKLLDVKAGKNLAPFGAKPVVDLRISDYVTAPPPSGDLTYPQALVLAMKAEKVSYRLYMDLAARCADPGHAAVLEGLAREEAVHKLRIELEYESKVLDEREK